MTGVQTCALPILRLRLDKIAAVLFSPLLVILAGFDSFRKALSLSGGVFLGLEYVLIAAVLWRGNAESRMGKAALAAIAILFALVAGKEVYSFFGA